MVVAQHCPRSLKGNRTKIVLNWPTNVPNIDAGNGIIVTCDPSEMLILLNWRYFDVMYFTKLLHKVSINYISCCDVVLVWKHLLMPCTLYKSITNKCYISIKKEISPICWLLCTHLCLIKQIIEKIHSYHLKILKCVFVCFHNTYFRDTGLAYLDHFKEFSEFVDDSKIHMQWPWYFANYSYYYEGYIISLDWKWWRNVVYNNGLQT